jgi:multidrug transporter EmrE-like cation transporter
MTAWIFLTLVVVSEAIGSTELKVSKGFTVLFPSALVLARYAGASTFSASYFLSLALKSISLNTAHSVWAGLGTALIALVGWLFLSEPMCLMKADEIALIIAGVVVVNLLGAH